MDRRGKQMPIRKPLQGYRVIEITRAQMGPFAGVMLADMGAEVIKVEPPETGEPTRWSYHWIVPGRVTPEGLDPGRLTNYELHPYMIAHNRGKKSITVDIDQEKGREIIYRLAKTADVFLQNLRPGYVAERGLGYEDIKEHNPQIIYASSSGFGGKGPLCMKTSYDLVGTGEAGILYQTGDPDGPPTPIGTAIGDQFGAVMGAYGIVLALLVRERTGIGQYVDYCHVMSQIYLQAWEITHYLNTGHLPPKGGRGLGLIRGVWFIFPTKTRWISIVGIDDRRWKGLCKAVGLAHLANDPRYSETESRSIRRFEIRELLDKVFPTRPAEEWIPLLEKEDVICGYVNSYKDMFERPGPLKEQIEAMEMVVERPHHYVGKVRMVGIPVKLSETPGEVPGPEPPLGHHTEEIMLELGYTWDDILKLRQEKVI